MEADEKKRKLAVVLKWGGGILGAAIISPIVFLALKGVLGLIALGVAAGTGMTILRLSPIVSMKASNLLMRMIANEAAANPIETMQNLLVEKTEELQMADKAIVDFETEVRNYDDETAIFARQYPAEAPSFSEISRKMHEGLEQQKQKQEYARVQLGQLDQNITKAKAIYKMSMAASKVTSLSKSAEAEVFQKIRETVALDAVRTSLNRSFAQLNMAISQQKNIAAPPRAERVAIEEEEVVVGAIVDKRSRS